MSTTTNFGWEKPANEEEFLEQLIQQNLDDIDSDLHAAATPPSARVYNSANLSISDSSDTALTFNGERWDTDAFHSTSANTSRLTIPTGKAGLYLMTCCVVFASNSTGYRNLYFKVNGSTVIGNALLSAVSGQVTTLSLSTVYRLAEGDYVEAYVIQTSGSPLNVTAAGNQSPEFTLTRLGGY